MISQLALTLVIFFLVSLLAAYLLFKFLKSSAVVTSHKHKAGGALAGFVIVYGVLFGSYYQFVGMQQKQLQSQYDQLKKSYDDLKKLNQSLLEAPPIVGQVGPDLQSVEFVLAVDKQEPDKDGRFALTPPCSLNPEGGRATIYALAQEGVFDDTGASWEAVKHLMTKEDLRSVRANLKLKQH